MYKKYAIVIKSKPFFMPPLFPEAGDKGRWAKEAIEIIFFDHFRPSYENMHISARYTTKNYARDEQHAIEIVEEIISLNEDYRETHVYLEDLENLKEYMTQKERVHYFGEW